MQVIKIKKSTASKVDMAALMIKTYCVLTDVKLGNTDVDVMAYMMVYGFKKSTKRLILSSKILNAKNSVENTMTRLRKVGLVVKDRDGYNMPCKALNVDVKGASVGMIIKFENV